MSRTAWILSLALFLGCRSEVRLTGFSETPPLPSPAPTASSAPTPSPVVVPGPVPVVSATALFSDGFDHSPDWQSGESGSALTGGSNCGWPRSWRGSAYFDGSCAPPPNWFSYRVAIPKRAGHAKTYVLEAASARGVSGKGMTYNSEPTEYGSWTGGGLDVYLGNTGHQEVYYRFWLQYDPVTWKWGTTVPNFALGKLIRISRFKDIPGDTTNPHMFLSAADGRQRPVLIPDWMNNPAYSPKVKLNYSHRYDPDYSSGGNDGIDLWGIPWPSDGLWHSYEWRVKMNSAPGVADGEWEVWIDGSGAPDKHFKKTGVPWVLAGGTTTPGWNWATVLDNMSNQTHPAPFANDEIGRIHMDDFVASTHYSGPPPAPVDVAVQSPRTGAARLTWTAGNNGAQYLLSGYRVYYGTTPGALDQSVTLGTALAQEITGLVSGQTYYFAVTAVNQASYDTNENESLRSAVVSVRVN